MRKALIAVTVLAIFGMLAPPAFAQAPAPAAPAPKVTITGIYEFISNYQFNMENADLSDHGRRDKGWYTRQRFVPTITGEVGKTKAVWAIELDFLNGENFPSTNATGGTTQSFDLDTDVNNARGCTLVHPSGATGAGCGGAVETKWLYLETPVTGPGSILPFIPFESIGRFGGMALGNKHNYKTSTILSGDAPALELVTTWAPNITSTFTYIQIGEGNTYDNSAVPFPTTNGGAREEWAIAASLDMEPIKGLKIKPTYAHVTYDRGVAMNTGTALFGTETKDGFTQSTTSWMYRDYLLLDARWTVGPFYIEPTVAWETGRFRRYAGNTTGSGCEPGILLNGGCTKFPQSGNINAWLYDVTGGFRTGPLNIEARGTWSPGMEAQHRVQNGSNINYFQGIHSGSVWYTGWTEIWAPGTEGLQVLGGGRIQGMSRGRGPSYDKYGLRAIALATDYNLTPALTIKALLNASWTDTEVDTGGALSGNGIAACGTSTAQGCRGDDSYLGTEIAGGFSWSFAPNVRLDVMGAYLFTGNALSHTSAGCHGAGGTTTAGVVGSGCNTAKLNEPDDVWRIATRIRYTF